MMLGKGSFRLEVRWVEEWDSKIRFGVVIVANSASSEGLNAGIEAEERLQTRRSGVMNNLRELTSGFVQ